MTTANADKEFAIPPALPAILKGFARETLRAQPQDIYKFAAQYFKELHASASQQTQPGFVGDKSANFQANVLQHLLDEDRSNIGLLHRQEVKHALCARSLAFSSRQIQIALANCDEDPEGLIDYRTVAPHLANVLMKSQNLPTQSAQPSLLRGQTSSEAEAQFLEAFQHADPDNSGSVSRQEFKVCLQSPDLQLCQKDVNTLLGEVEEGSVDYTSLAQDVFKILSQRLADELLLNSNLVSSAALSQHLSQLLQQKDSQHTGTATIPQLVQTLLALSHDSLGLSNSYLACVIGHTAANAKGGSLSYGQWVNEAAAMMWGCLDPKASDARMTAVQEFRDRGAAQKKRSANAEAVKDSLQQAFDAADTTAAGLLSKEQCAQTISKAVSDLLHLSPEELVALQSVVESFHDDSLDHISFVDLCSRTLTQLEEEQYVFQYLQVHA